MIDKYCCSIREIDIEDAELTYKWRNSGRAAYLNQGASTVNAQRQWIREKLDRQDEINHIIVCDDNPVGMISIVTIDTSLGTAETGRFLIGEEDYCKGKPVACDALILHYNYAFDQLGLNKLYGHIDPLNKQMIKFHKYTGAYIYTRRDECKDNKHFVSGCVNIEITGDLYRTRIFNKLTKIRNLIK